MIARLEPSLELLQIPFLEARLEIVDDMLNAQEEGRLALGALATADMPDLFRLSRTSLGKQDDTRFGQKIRPARRCLSREKPHHLRLITMLIGDGEITESTIQLNKIVKVSRHNT
ncbi:hypothetical protein RAA17_25265 [Komagataeibacter rhaeticus]|nr:hypothetical protein [Komagataeibacter rhaeticus]